MDDDRHNLKIKHTYFDEIETGVKTFEIRKNDRDFKLGDRVALHEYKGKVKTGRVISFAIAYIFYGGEYGLKEGYCIFNW